MASFTLCRICVFFKAGEGTCSRSVTALRGCGAKHTLAALVRLDETKCGLQARWFQEPPKAEARGDFKDEMRRLACC